MSDVRDSAGLLVRWLRANAIYRLDAEHLVALADLEGWCAIGPEEFDHYNTAAERAERDQAAAVLTTEFGRLAEERRLAAARTSRKVGEIIIDVKGRERSLDAELLVLESALGEGRAVDDDYRAARIFARSLHGHAAHLDALCDAQDRLSESETRKHVLSLNHEAALKAAWEY